MRSLKLGILMAVFALSAIGAANASAAEFTASATGNITGHAVENQKFTTNGGTVECKKADISGTITKTASPEQTVLVTYTECNAFSFPVHITGGIHYIFTANGGVHVESNITITVTGGIFGECTITVGSGQWLTLVNYDNISGKIKVTPNVTGITYTSSGGICGSSGTNGTYTGASEVEREGGGTVSVD